MVKKSTKSKRSKPSKSSKKASRKLAKATKRSRKQTQSTKTKIPVAKTRKLSKSPKFQSPHGRAKSNPFREGSAYALAYDVLAHAGSDGITRQQLVSEVAKATKKDEQHAGYDCAVLLSAKENGERHQSCRSGFWVEKINDHLRLHVTPSPTAGK